MFHDNRTKIKNSSRWKKMKNENEENRAEGIKSPGGMQA